MPAEFGYKFREWTRKYEKEEKIAFGVIDVSYIDGSNFELARSFGLSKNDAPTIFSLDRPSTGNYYRQKIKFNMTNFEEISEGFKQKIESGDYQLFATHWKYQHLNLINAEYLANHRYLGFIKNLIGL
jgi:hypothetical protein